MITRRECLQHGTMAAAALAAAGCVPITRGLSQPAVEPGWAEIGAGETPEDSLLRRTVSRTSFGPRPGDLKRVRQIGIDAYLEEQLHPERLEESPAVAWRLWPLDTLQVDTDFRFEYPKEQVQAELQQAAVIRAVYSRRQLQEVMVDFWTDHFNISQLKGDSAFFKSADDEAVIRRHALGKFHDLLLASARSPAMLHYLDNARNTRTELNENYGRELMELHTLGVHGGYTQHDVQEVARCFTGWSIQNENTWWHGEFIFRPEEHDDGPRRVLGIPLPPGMGVRHGERVLDILAEHPSTARFVARKLCRRFIADEDSIPGRLVDRLARTFLATHGDIRAVLGVLFRSDDFRHGGGPKLKRPFDFAVSSLRAVNADTDGAGVLPHLRRMGQAPYQWAMPNGYPDHAEAWLPGLLARWNFAVDLASGRIAGTAVDLEGQVRAAGASPAEALQVAILGNARRAMSDRLASVLAGNDGLTQAAALLIASPEFQWR